MVVITIAESEKKGVERAHKRETPIACVQVVGIQCVDVAVGFFSKTGCFDRKSKPMSAGFSLRELRRWKEIDDLTVFAAGMYVFSGRNGRYAIFN